MRFAYLALVLPLSFTSGCSVLIAESGKDMSKLTTREQVHASMGKPAAAGIENGKPFEEYLTRQKISEADSLRNNSLCMGFVMTYGLYELISFPAELYRLGSRTLRGQTVRVTYDENGKVSVITLEDEVLNQSALNERINDDWLKRSNSLSDTATTPADSAVASPASLSNKK